jgi:iron complex outermembrane receptor protein
MQTSFDLTENINFGAVARYVGELSDPYVSDYIGLDLRLGWSVNKVVELSIVGQNLVDSGHTEFIPDSPATKDVERSIYGKILFTF